jgi:FAD/FMN-containing dehydrogenase
MNEADFHLATWKEDFYGENYARLRTIKAKYDPSDLFYATTAVGSDAWSVAADRRMCRS